MRGRPLEIHWQPEDTVESLRTAFREADDPLVKTRLQALWLLRTGKRMSEVAPVVGFVDRTVQNWLALYRAEGRAALTRIPKPPARPERMTDAQWEQVRDHLRQGTTRTVEPLRRWIRPRWQLAGSYNGLRRALRRKRVRLKVPRPRHEKTNRAVQAAWKKGGSKLRLKAR